MQPPQSSVVLSTPTFLIQDTPPRKLKVQYTSKQVAPSTPTYTVPSVSKIEIPQLQPAQLESVPGSPPSNGAHRRSLVNAEWLNVMEER